MKDEKEGKRKKAKGKKGKLSSFFLLLHSTFYILHSTFCFRATGYYSLLPVRGGERQGQKSVGCWTAVGRMVDHSRSDGGPRLVGRWTDLGVFVNLRSTSPFKKSKHVSNEPVWGQSIEINDENGLGPLTVGSKMQPLSIL